jgi:hypothetical protein
LWANWWGSEIDRKKPMSCMKILVHDGKAHQDDFLASCVCLFKLNSPLLFRQKCDDFSLKDSNCWVLDQGRKFEPEFHNFDHHQLEEEICAFTMVLDYFYGKDYRKYMPQLRFVEIFDSYGPIKAAEFLGMSQDNLDLACSPIHSAMVGMFSKIEGEVMGPILSIMEEIGKEICTQIESTEVLLKILDDAKYIEYNKIRILDTTQCKVADGIKHDQLPTKIYSKINNLEPDVILTVDSRQNGYRMVSINTNVLKFKPNDLAYFTHNSGFLIGFKNLSDYEAVLLNCTELHESKK